MDHKKPFKVLHTLPIIKGMTGIAKTMGNMFQLLQVQTEVCKQRQLTWINGSQGYSAETSGGLLMSISAEGAKAFSEEILAIEGQPAWVIGTVEVVSNIVVGSYSFFIGWWSFLFKHIFALDIKHLLRLAVERRESWTIRRLSKCSWSLEVRPNQDSWSCQCSLISIKDNQRPSNVLFCESEELESTAAKVFTCTICKSAQLQRQILETGDKGISSLSQCRWSHLTYFWCHSLRADRSDKSEESDKGGRANDGLPEILFEGRMGLILIFSSFLFRGKANKYLAAHHHMLFNNYIELVSTIEMEKWLTIVSWPYTWEFFLFQKNAV